MRTKKIDLMITIIVMLLIVLAFNFQPIFHTDIVHPQTLAVTKTKLSVTYLSGDNCNMDLSVDLDFLEFDNDSIFLRWENIDSGVYVCGYEVRVEIVSDQSWLANFTLFINGNKIVEDVSVMKPSQYNDTSAFTINLSEYRTIRVMYPAETIIGILLLKAI